MNNHENSHCEGPLALSDKAPASASKSELMTSTVKQTTSVGIHSEEKTATGKKNKQMIEWSEEDKNNRSVNKMSSSKPNVLTFSAKKAPVFVYHETKSSQKIRIDSKLEASLQDSTSSQGAKPFSKTALAMEMVQPTSALTKATADGLCHFQDETNTPD